MPPPKFIFVRHGEAEHNVAFRDVGTAAFRDSKYKDAPLTTEGILQARKTAEALAHLKILDIWSSPLTRCIQTGIELYEELDIQGLYLHDSLLERLGGGHVCNERKHCRELKEKFSNWDTVFLPDFPPFWVERENETALQRRMLSFILLLSELYKNSPEESHILIVSHADAIFSLTKPFLKNAEYVIRSLEDLLA